MPLKQPFEHLIGRLREGDNDASTEVVQRFTRRLVGLASARLPDSLNAKVDPEDVVQSVFKSFFRRHCDGQFTLESWDNMWTLLTVLTVRKCGHRIDQYLAARRDVRRESRPAPTDESSVTDQIADPAPTALETLLLIETVEQVVRSLKEEDRPIVALRLQGFSVKEISDQTGRSERTIHRALESVREQLTKATEEA